MNTYKFTALCKSGQTKTFEFQAENYRQARKELDRLIEIN